MAAKRLLRKTLVLMTLSLVVFLILTVLIPYLRFTFKKPADDASTAKLQYIAHRGASQSAPENTLEAFRIAAESNVDMIELDVHLSKDGQVIVMHDSNFKRTTGHDAEVANMTLDEIRKLSIIGSAEKVPTLDEVLKLIGGKKKVLIELKWPKSGIYQTLVDATMKTVNANKATDWIVLQSFEKKYLEQAVRDYPQVECHQLIFGQSSILPIYYETTIRMGYFKPIAGVKSVNLFYLYLSDGFVEKMHQQGLKVRVFTANDAKKSGRIAAFGADGIITDNISLAN